GMPSQSTPHGSKTPTPHAPPQPETLEKHQPLSSPPIKGPAARLFVVQYGSARHDNVRTGRVLYNCFGHPLRSVHKAGLFLATSFGAALTSSKSILNVCIRV